MDKFSRKLTTIGLGVGILVAGQLITPGSVAAQFGSQGPAIQMETTKSSGFTSAIKSGIGKVAGALTPSIPKREASDPISLSTKPTPSPELYLSIAQIAEESGRFDEAQRRYEEALALAPERLDTLLRHARFKDRRGRLSEATGIYQQAARLHPTEPSVFNDLGLCFARRNMLPQSLSSLDRAIQLRPEERLYRNNMATILVEIGNVDAAYDHLKAVHTEAVAFYNLGFLMQKKGDSRGAAVLFSKALAKNPSFVEAKIWLDRLSGQAPAATEDRRASPLQATVPRRSLRVPISLRSTPTARPEQGSMSRGGQLPRLRQRSSPDRGVPSVRNAPMPPLTSVPSTGRPNPPMPTVQPLPPISDGPIRR